MKACATAFLVVILVVPASVAQTPVIGVHAELSDCQLYDGAGTFHSVWIVQESGPAVEAARFRVDLGGWTATYAGAWFPVVYVIEPDPFAGDTFSLASCGAPPNVFARLDFLSIAPSPECAAEISVVPDPAAASGEIEALDCDSNVLFGASGTVVVVNPNADTCPCVLGPVDTEACTWGLIKALYR